MAGGNVAASRSVAGTQSSSFSMSRAPFSALKKEKGRTPHSKSYSAEMKQKREERLKNEALKESTKDHTELPKTPTPVNGVKGTSDKEKTAAQIMQNTIRRRSASKCF